MKSSRKYITSILSYITLRTIVHVMSAQGGVCPTNDVIDGYTCSRNVWGFVFSSLVLPLSQSQQFRMIVFPFFLATDIIFEIHPVPFLIVLHHVICLVGHFMIWNCSSLLKYYTKIMVAFEFGSGLTNLYDWLRRFQIQTNWIVIVGMTVSNLTALYFVSKLGMDYYRKLKKTRGYYELICVCLLCMCTLGFACIRQRETMALIGFL